MKLAVVFLIIICLLLLFLFFGNRITTNLFNRGIKNLSTILLVSASPEDSSRVTNLQDKFVSAFREGNLRQHKLKGLAAIVDTALVDSIISKEERENILQFMEALVGKDSLHYGQEE